MTNALQVSLILPTRNEAGNIAEAIRRAHEALDGIPHEIIVVDDNSPDGTADLVRSIAADDPSVRCIQRIGRRGLASAWLAYNLYGCGRSPPWRRSRACPSRAP